MSERQYEILHIKTVVQGVMGTTLTNPRRTSNASSARMLFSHIMFNSGFNVKVIAAHLNKDSSTVSYYNSKASGLILFDPKFRAEFELCMKRLEYKPSFKDLNSEKKSVRYLVEKDKQDKRLEGIFSVIRRTVPVGEEARYEELIESYMLRKTGRI